MRQKSSLPAPIQAKAPTRSSGLVPTEDGSIGNAGLAEQVGSDQAAPVRSQLAVRDGDELLWSLLGLPLHRRYRPLGKIDRQVYKDGSELRSYATGTGASFEAALDAQDYTTRISGSNLKLKEQLDIAGRGYTGEAVGKVPGAGQHSAHLIADEFTGSGYKEAGNLIATSASYNWLEMSAAEDLIREAVEAHGAESFDMDVSVDWGDMDDPGVIQSRVDEVVKTALAEDPDLSECEIASLRADEEARLRESLATFQERYGDDIRRCMGVRYDVRLQLADGSELVLDPIALGADKYLGFEEEDETDALTLDALVPSAPGAAAASEAPHA